MRFRVAFLLALALFCPVAWAQVPKFTIVSITADPPGPHAPGAKFKIKVAVRNDGDTIPAGRRFDFVFTTPDALAIAPPTGTPALFFGYCPGATPANMVCQCFAAWEKGQTVELQTEVTVGSSARGNVTVTFTVKSGTVSETSTQTMQIALGGPELVPDAVFNKYNDHPPGTQLSGRRLEFHPRVFNAGSVISQGGISLNLQLSGGLSCQWFPSGFTWQPPVPIVVRPETFEYFFSFDSGGLSLKVNEPGFQSIFITISGGGDVDPSNNTKTFSFEVVPSDPDPLNRLDRTEELAEILGR